MNSPRVLVAGGTGRLGTLIVTALAARGADVRVLTRDRHRAAHLTSGHVEVTIGDVREPASVVAAAANRDVVVSAVHGFAGPGGGSPESVDRDGNTQLFRAAHAAGAAVVLMSVVGAAPDSPFELFRMKHAAETALAAGSAPATVVRATAFLELWIEILDSTSGRAHRPVVFGRGRNPITFVSVRDVAALATRVVLDPTTRGDTLEIGGPDDLTLSELARMVAARHGSSRGPRHAPRPALHVMASTIGRLRPELGRQARAALAMDRYDMTYHADTHDARTRFPDLPLTSAVDVLRELPATRHPA